MRTTVPATIFVALCCFVLVFGQRESSPWDTRMVTTLTTAGNMSMAAVDRDDYISGGKMVFTWNSEWWTPEPQKIAIWLMNNYAQFDVTLPPVAYRNNDPNQRLAAVAFPDRIEITLPTPSLNFPSYCPGCNLIVQDFVIDVRGQRPGDLVVANGEIIYTISNALGGGGGLSFTNPIIPIIRVTAPAARRP